MPLYVTSVMTLYLPVQEEDYICYSCYDIVSTCPGGRLYATRIMTLYLTWPRTRPVGSTLFSSDSKLKYNNITPYKKDTFLCFNFPHFQDFIYLYNISQCVNILFTCKFINTRIIRLSRRVRCRLLACQVSFLLHREEISAPVGDWCLPTASLPSQAADRELPLVATSGLVLVVSIHMSPLINLSTLTWVMHINSSDR